MMKIICVKTQRLLRPFMRLIGKLGGRGKSPAPEADKVRLTPG